MTTQGIYKIENRLSGKVYIGSSTNIENRWRQHRSMLCSGKHCNAHLQAAWNKYGAAGFVFNILEEADASMLLPAEQKYLNELFASGNCYNIDTMVWPAGPRSEETRRKISKAHMGRKFSEEHKRNISKAKLGNQYCLGRVVSDETRRKIGNANRGKKRTEEARRERSKRMMGNQHLLGYRHSDETRRKMCEARKGHVVSDETKRKQSAAMMGKQNALGCKRSDETRRRMSEAAKRRWARDRAAAPNI